jgi:mitochondrial fission protein ELM1
MRILILSDGRPGHYRQSEAIVAAIARKRPVETSRIEVRLTKAIPRALAPRLARFLPPHAYLVIAHGLSERDFPACDLVVSAGAITFGANIALAKLRAIPNVIAGSLRGLNPHDVSLTLLPYARARELPNHACLIKPAAIDPDTLPAARPWSGLPSEDERSIGVLIGGPTATAAFDALDWKRLADLLTECADQPGVSLRLATSPRTPSESYDALEPLGARPNVQFIDFRKAGPGSAGPIYECDAMFVTSDSMSMITEAVAAQRPAIALAPAITKPNADDEAVETLAKDNYLRIVRLVDATPQSLDAALMSISPMRENHLDILAETILSRTRL